MLPTPNSPGGPSKKKAPAKLRLSFPLGLFSAVTCGTESSEPSLPQPEMSDDNWIGPAKRQTHLPRLNEERLYIRRHVCHLQTLDYSKQKVRAHLETYTLVRRNAHGKDGARLTAVWMCRVWESGSARCLTEQSPGLHTPQESLNGSCSGVD